MVDTNNNIGDVGIFTLESLTTGMYVDPFDALRELVQNSYDSINEAQKSRLIKEDEGLLNITVNKLLEQIIFKDNGVGIKNELIVDRLLTIGNSSKRLGENVGFRGIGRLACIAYCDEIIYKTSFKNENIQNIIKLDCEKLKEYYSPIDKKEKKLADVLQNVITRKQIDDNVESHFYEVSLIGLKGRGIDFLDESKLISYLSQVSPVDFNSHNFIYASEIQQEIKTQNCNHKNINISVNNKHKIISQIKKLYKTNYHTKKNEHIGITGINFLPNVYNDCYWGWVSKSHFLGQINNEMAGIRIRYGNILIGGTKLTDDIFLKNGDSRRFNKYYKIGL